MARLLCVISLVLACGGRPSAPAHRTPQPTPSPGSMATPIAPTANDTSESRCTKLVEHALALGEAERPVEHALTPGERDRIAAQLREAWSPACTQTTSRGYDCALAAKTLAALEACGG